MGLNNINNNLHKKNSIISRFQKGELSTKETFKLLRNLNNENIRISKNDACLLKKDILVNSSDNEENNYLNSTSFKNSMEELDKLIGLNTIKKLIKEYVSFLKVQELRTKYGLKNKSVVMHMIFKGNPGTGKTTVARIIGKIFSNIGFLDNGEIIEAERADLVGEYIGHTAKKTKEMIEKALGGVLFVDEAYALARGGERDFGKEAIDTMVKSLEDHRDNIIVILAGYKSEMEYFLKQNPGLKSRFSIHLDFPDYSIEELVEISELMYEEREYILTQNSKHYIYNILSKIRSNEGDNKGNARTVRNLVEKSIRHQAQRIINLKNITKKDLMTIKIEDLAGGSP